MISFKSFLHTFFLLIFTLTQTAQGGSCRYEEDETFQKTKAITTSLSNGMNFHKTLETMASSETVKAVAFSVLSAAAMYNLMGPVTAPGAEQAAEKAVEKSLEQSFTDCLKFSFTKAGVDATLKVMIYGENVGSAIKEGLISGAIDTVGSFAAGQIGKMYDSTGQVDKGLNFITHKAAHAAVGAVMGIALIPDDAKRGAISGAIGAVAAEIVAETCLKTSAELKQQILKDAEAKGQPLDPKGRDFNEQYQSRLRTQADWSKMAAGIVTLLAGQDVSVSLEAAENALRHNYMIAMTAGLEEQMLKEKGDQEALDRLALERQGRGMGEKSQGSRNSSPTRLQNTHLYQAGQKIGEYIPEGVKKGVSQSIEYVNDLIPEPVKNVAGPILEVLDCVPDAAGTLVRRGARAVGVSQGVAQDLGDAVHAGAAFVLPGTAVKTVKATVGVAQEVVGVVKGVRIVENSASVRTVGEVVAQHTNLAESSALKWHTQIEFKGNKVYQRNDIFNTNSLEPIGMENINRMKLGKAPKGPDGKPINLHHMLQTQKGPIAEVTESFHSANSKIIHINPSSIPSGIDRTTFNKWRKDYWKHRVEQILKDKQ